MNSVVKGVWATPAAREEFNPFERATAVEAYEQYGPQLFVGGVGFAVYGLPGSRRLLLTDRNGCVTLMTVEEVEAERRRR